jgi:hypothetical protein
MKWICSAIFVIVISSCNKNDNAGLSVFNPQITDRWEIATTDSINSIIKKNELNETDSKENKMLTFYRDGLFHHLARRIWISDIKKDPIFQDIYFNNYIIIEKTRESRTYFDLILDYNDSTFILSYLYNNPYGPFQLKCKNTINSDSLILFLDKIRLHKSIKMLDQPYSGEVVVSYFSDNKIEIFPFLTYNLDRDLLYYCK